MKFTFSAELDSEFSRGSTTTREFECDYLPEVLEEFEIFLRGCGYYFDGRIDITNEDYNIIRDEEYGESTEN